MSQLGISSRRENGASAVGGLRFMAVSLGICWPRQPSAMLAAPIISDPTISEGEGMSPTPPLPQFIGRTERPLRALMDLVLADTGGTFPQWVALNITAAGGDSIDRSELIAQLAGALQIDDTAAEATIAEMADEQLLQTASGSE